MTNDTRPRTVVLDAEALTALAEARSRSTLARLRVILDLDGTVVLPAVILAEVMTGRDTDAAAWRVVNAVVPADATVPIAAAAGRLRERAEVARRKKRDLTIDAIVAATAIACAPAVIVTGDVDDMSLLTQGTDVTVVPV